MADMKNNKIKIGIITWHYYNNYGSMLQTYALIKTLRDQGNDARVLNYRNLKFGKVPAIKNIVKSVCIHFQEKFIKKHIPIVYFPNDRFRQFFNETRLVYTGEELQKQCKNFDVIICGSDQIWAPNVFNPIYLLDFVPDGITKISYAASIGLNYIPEKLKAQYFNLLRRFDSISVRESTAQKLIRQFNGIESTLVLDPTLLVDSNHWSSIAAAPSITGPYIFCYFLKEDHKYKDAVKSYSDKTGIKIIGISACKHDGEWMETLNEKTIGPKEFIGLIKDAHSVITDSYHGSIFSLIFHKNFITFQRFSSDDKICQNSRINQLNDYFDIDDNMIDCNQKSILNPKGLDWDKFEDKLYQLRLKSVNYIKESLSS